MLLDSNIIIYAAIPAHRFLREMIRRKSPSIINQATLLRQQKKMSLGDALIAATALEKSLVLLTRNKTDFQHIAPLQVVDPFEEPV